MSTFFNGFDAACAARQLRIEGAARILGGINKTYHRGILAEFMDTSRHPLAEAEKIRGEHKTPQNYHYVKNFPPESVAHLLMRECEAWLSGAFATLADNPLREPIRFNDKDMHWYPASDVGVGFHRDGARYRQLIAILVLAGDGQFRLADDRDDTPTSAPRMFAVPGDVILLRAGDFHGLCVGDVQRLHGVFNIRKFRATLSFRQTRSTALTA